MYLNRFCYLLLIFAAVGSIFTSHPVAMWFLLANVLTLAIYGIDKTAARKTLAQSAGIHFVGVWGCRWVAWGDCWSNNSSVIKRKSSHSKHTLLSV
ncbi:cyanate transport [Salmonella enterica subsp. enterica serovar Typhimurium]|nr:cyanate transport [Salmonella enterica subsp. enterica serovar Typhimurium]